MESPPADGEVRPTGWRSPEGRHTEEDAPMSSRDRLERTVLPIPDQPPVGVTTYDAKDPATSLPAHRAAAAAGGRAERAHRADRRRAASAPRAPSAARSPPRRSSASPSRASSTPLPHDRALLAHPAGAAHGPQPPLGGHGRHHRDRHLGARLQLDPAQHDGAAGRDAEAQRLLDGPVRQVPRGAGLGDQPDGPVRRVADRAAASSTSTASSAARPTSTRRRSTATRCRWSPTARRRRATTSPRT